MSLVDLRSGSDTLRRDRSIDSTELGDTLDALTVEAMLSDVKLVQKFLSDLDGISAAVSSAHTNFKNQEHRLSEARNAIRPWGSLLLDPNTKSAVELDGQHSPPLTRASG
jgi:hypothetical protein